MKRVLRTKQEAFRISHSAPAAHSTLRGFAANIIVACGARCKIFLSIRRAAEETCLTSRCRSVLGVR
jgi:hypothetical protein